MTLAELAVSIVVIVGAMLTVSLHSIIGWNRIFAFRSEYRKRIRAVGPYFVLLGAVLLFNTVTRTLGPEVSWLIGWNITGLIHAIEGSFVASLQTILPRSLVPFFGFVYVYGYVFLLVFPLLAYFALDDMRHLRETCLAYTMNYGIGLIIYVLLISYGPRNLTPDQVESLLYTSWPQSQLLVSQVNTNTNVFPSLHTSLSTTVAILAYRTHDVYPRWTAVSTGLALSIVGSTMYLGIHWLTDVIAGMLLAILAVGLAIKLNDAERVNEFWNRFSPRIIQ